MMAMAEPIAAVRRLLQAMPKAELHLHLDGCLRPVTALELAAERGVTAPTTYLGMFDALVAPAQPDSQADLLRAFELPLSLMQDAEALGRVTTDLVEDKAADRVRYLEIKWAPALHLERGLTLDGAIDAVAGAAREAARRCGVVVTLTSVILRGADPASNVEVAHATVRRRDDIVTGFDLAGLEAEFPDPLEHSAAFDVARAGGLGITVHCGELRDDGALVERALALRPTRIAHGASVATNPALVADLIARGVSLDLCPTSNVQACTVDSLATHPAAELHRRGLGISLSTDDITISDVTLSEELLACHTQLGMTPAELWACNLHALDVAFVDDVTRAALRADFTAWAAAIPELARR